MSQYKGMALIIMIIKKWWEKIFSSLNKISSERMPLFRRSMHQEEIKTTRQKIT